MKVIELSQGYETLVDDEDYESLPKSGWYVRKGSGGKVYAERHFGSQTRLMHNVLMGGRGVDHINGSGLDNQRSNLRFATQSQQGANRRVVKAASGFKGVFKYGNRWRAEITCQYKVYRSEKYKYPQEAALAYDKLATDLFGEFAATNKILGLLL